jgi:hypothetical protein
VAFIVLTGMAVLGAAIAATMLAPHARPVAVEVIQPEITNALEEAA